MYLFIFTLIQIYFPHGAMLRAQLTGGGHAQFMNVWLNPSPADFNRVEGR